MYTNSCEEKPELAFIGQENLGNSHVTITFAADRAFTTVVVFACLDNSDNIYGMSDSYSVEILDSSDAVLRVCATGLTDQTEAVCAMTGRKIKISSTGNARLNIAKVMAFEGTPVSWCTITSFTSNMAGVTETVDIYT